MTDQWFSVRWFFMLIYPSIRKCMLLQEGKNSVQPAIWCVFLVFRAISSGWTWWDQRCCCFLNYSLISSAVTVQNHLAEIYNSVSFEENSFSDIVLLLSNSRESQASEGVLICSANSWGPPECWCEAKCSKDSCWSKFSFVSGSI